MVMTDLVVVLNQISKKIKSVDDLKLWGKMELYTGIFLLGHL